ncbi:MAG: polysaccharide deacetylase family protein [Candidatus Contendobacter sp.]|nr:polysaccharide deacetylase family protein [Candidatus Contendobacter sp.]
MSRFAWSTVSVLIALSLILTWLDPSPYRTQLLLGSTGFYAALLAAGALLPQMDFYLRAVRRGPADQPWVALTFDDGPHPDITPLLLDLLRNERIPATFFCVGEAARRYPDLVAQAAADGHLTGNHSDQHRYGWAFSSKERLYAEFAAANRTFIHILGHAPRFVRTPVGVSRPNLDEVLQRLQLRNIAWDVRGLESLYRDPDRIAARIARRSRNGSIILLHELYYGVRHFDPPQVLATAQLTIDRLRQRGFRFVRLDHLLEQPDCVIKSGDWDSLPAAGAFLIGNGADATTRYRRAAGILSRMRRV